MNQTGFIGYGNMGRVLINSFLDSNILKSEEIVLFNRTENKLTQFRLKYPESEIVKSIQEVGKRADTIFVCSSTGSVKDIIEELNCDDRKHIVLINAGIKICSVEKIYSGQITRIIPTITSEVFTGYTIINYNKKVTEDNRRFIKKLLNSIGDVVELKEEQFSAGSDLTSCAPAPISEIHNLYISEISRSSGIPLKVAETMFNSTLNGTLGLLDKTGETSRELINRVATKGGSTEAGIKVLRKNLPEIFSKMLKATERSHSIREKSTSKQFEKN